MVGLTTKKINQIITPHLEQVFDLPRKYLFIINKNHYENEKVSIVIAVDKIEKNKYILTIVTALHRDTDLILFAKIEHLNRIYTTITYEEVLNQDKSISEVKKYNPSDAVPAKRITYKSDKLGLRIVKRANKKDKYFKHKNIKKMIVKNNTQRKLIALLSK